MADNMRVMRIVLPVDQIRRMDQLILQGAGGFQNRNEFISEAIEAQMLELSYPAADASHGPVVREPDDVEASRCRVPLEVTSVDWGQVMSAVEKRPSTPLFGLHNRDYPSLWAFWRVALLTAEKPVALTTCLRLVTDEAWDAGRQLQGLTATDGDTITSLFPTNSDKRDAAEDAFREFALGSAIVEGESVRVSGPLFEWGICGAELCGTEVSVGITKPGWELLTRMDGLRPVQPHTADQARAFLAHLQQHASADWQGFDLVLDLCANGSPTRADLVDAFTTFLALTSENAASTYAAGYVARCREWGLLEAKQVKGTYVITDLGRSVRKEAENGSR